MIDKSEMLINILERYDVHYNPARSGEQSVSCPNKEAHSDRNPSCSVNLGKGVLFCQGCGLSGDAYSVVMSIEGVPFTAAIEQLGKPYVISESDFLTI